MNQNNNITHINPIPKLTRYTYSISFSSEREFTYEESMELSRLLSSPVREIIKGNTGVDIFAHNTVSGIEKD